MIPAKYALSEESENDKQKLKYGKWSQLEDEKLRSLIQIYGDKQWQKISSHFKDRSSIQCLHRWCKILKPGLVKGPWSAEENQKLLEWVNREGPTKWSQCSEYIKGRSGKQCRERWFNILNPNIIKGNWTDQEDEIIFKLYIEYGSQWSKISSHIPGRTENSIKNRFYSTIRKIALEQKKNMTNLVGKSLNSNQFMDEDNQNIITENFIVANQDIVKKIYQQMQIMNSTSIDNDDLLHEQQQGTQPPSFQQNLESQEGTLATIVSHPNNTNNINIKRKLPKQKRSSYRQQKLQLKIQNELLQNSPNPNATTLQYQLTQQIVNKKQQIQLVKPQKIQSLRYEKQSLNQNLVKQVKLSQKHYQRVQVPQLHPIKQQLTHQPTSNEKLQDLNERLIKFINSNQTTQKNQIPSPLFQVNQNITNFYIQNNSQQSKLVNQENINQINQQNVAQNTNQYIQNNNQQDYHCYNFQQPLINQQKNTPQAYYSPSFVQPNQNYKIEPVLSSAILQVNDKQGQYYKNKAECKDQLQQQQQFDKILQNLKQNLNEPLDKGTDQSPHFQEKQQQLQQIGPSQLLSNQQQNYFKQEPYTNLSELQQQITEFCEYNTSQIIQNSERDIYIVDKLIKEEAQKNINYQDFPNFQIFNNDLELNKNYDDHNLDYLQGKLNELEQFIEFNNQTNPFLGQVDFDMQFS